MLATFPLCIRLRNDADQRTGIRHLHVTDRFASETMPDEDRATRRVFAARLLVKPRDPDSTPHAGEEAQQETYSEDRVGGPVCPARPPHHRTCGPASGGSSS
ncbi:hypothetical protein [Streptomyces sp. NBC_01320]|uniref:hypothetical protein n=1 Tax=Streptomyces sp. NBC_01320 TaxID=2903824 RepID=UPI002E125C7C|nr:hypothetical protein OG395_53680 [Streptomyces sp. NBC_01320]